MAAFSTKPGLRYSVPDWDHGNRQLSETAERRRQSSQDTRQEGRMLRNETTSKTSWNESDSSRRLTERVWDITRWRDTLEASAQELDREMDALTLSKEEMERALAATLVPLEVTVECMVLREGRRGNELLSDPVEAQLKKEVDVIERAQHALQQGIDSSFTQLCLLQEARHQVTNDLENKMDAQGIDTTCLKLTMDSPEISLKPNPTRIPISSSTPQQWEQFSQHNMSRAQQEMQVSLQLREETRLSRLQIQNELQSQRIATEFSIRKRTHQLQQAHDERKWQLQSTQEEISQLEKDILGLEGDLQAKTAPLKLAHTRLEHRTERPGMDLCRDEVQYGLMEEVKQLEGTIQALKQKLAEAQHSLQNLQLHEARMQEDLSRKQEAISLERSSLETRGRLSSIHTSGPMAVVPLTNSSGRHNLMDSLTS
ncbi:tektin-2 [Hypomesus transpacificus]|uniref:tektin-2 n=1 Tax=Hypomesus transpacificus TaxID=137520 RepID=UPI001F075A0E|nr:tektin-2 [Hypomesus transpacificus]